MRRQTTILTPERFLDAFGAYLALSGATTLILTERRCAGLGEYLQTAVANARDGGDPDFACGDLEACLAGLGTPEALDRALEDAQLQGLLRLGPGHFRVAHDPTGARRTLDRYDIPLLGFVLVAVHAWTRTPETP